MEMGITFVSLLPSEKVATIVALTLLLEALLCVLELSEKSSGATYQNQIALF
jgi:hypothetical protein